MINVVVPFSFRRLSAVIFLVCHCCCNFPNHGGYGILAFQLAKLGENRCRISNLSFKRSWGTSQLVALSSSVKSQTGGRSYTSRTSGSSGNGRSYTSRPSPKSSGRQQSGGGRGGGGGGGRTDDGQVLKLVNPLKVQKVQSEQSSPRRSDSEESGSAKRSGRDESDTGRKSGGGTATADSPDGVNGEIEYEYEPKAGKSFRDKLVEAKDRDGGGRRGRANTGRRVENERDGPTRRASLRVGAATRKGRQAETNQRRSSLKRRDRSAEKEAKAEAALERKTVQLSDGPMSVMELAEVLDEKPVSVIKFLMADLGIMASMTQNLDPATCVAVVEGFGKIVGGDDFDEELLEVLAEDSALNKGVVEDFEDEENLVPRPPVVTIMGHVDHGKTSLLDAIRNTDVTAGEAGGITQHIQAYQVNHNGALITFIDTPGHSAFTDMRERGANITDIVILVVAADDGVKQQTADSIMCARRAGVPMVVAINKCDLETADPVKVMTDLTAYDVLTEDFGGDVLSSQISAKLGSNLDDLLDKVMLQAEVQGLRANPNRKAEGFVVEANVEKGLGTVATTLVKKGTLRVGDVFVAGETYGRVRALLSTTDDKTRLKEAGPSVPVRVVGFEGVPAAGDILVVAEDDQTARELAESRQRIARERQSSSYQQGLMSSITSAFGSAKERREICVVVKADVQGSAEALTRSLRELTLENEEAIVVVKVLVSEAGEVSKSDIAIASVTPGTTVIAFNVAASFAAIEDARMMGVPIEYYNIVYDAIESVESRMQEILSPTPDGEYAGAAVVQAVFNIGGTGNIAGSKCTDGFLRKGANVRVMRGDKILVETKVRTLRSFKTEVDSIEEGSECGIGLVDFESFETGDIIECYVE